jgi:hypothetical protein
MAAMADAGGGGGGGAPATLGDLTSEYTRGRPGDADTRGASLVEKHNERMQAEKETAALEKASGGRRARRPCSGARAAKAAGREAHPAQQQQRRCWSAAPRRRACRAGVPAL